MKVVGIRSVWGLEPNGAMTIWNKNVFFVMIEQLAIVICLAIVAYIVSEIAVVVCCHIRTMRAQWQKRGPDTVLSRRPNTNKSQLHAAETESTYKLANAGLHKILPKLPGDVRVGEGSGLISGLRG